MIFNDKKFDATDSALNDQIDCIVDLIKFNNSDLLPNVCDIVDTIDDYSFESPLERVFVIGSVCDKLASNPL